MASIEENWEQSQRFFVRGMTVLTTEWPSPLLTSHGGQPLIQRQECDVEDNGSEALKAR